MQGGIRGDWEQHRVGKRGTRSPCPGWTAPGSGLTAPLTSSLQDRPPSADGHAPDTAPGQGSQCDSPKQPAGQESPTLPMPSAVKVMPVPLGCPGQEPARGIQT